MTFGRTTRYRDDHIVYAGIVGETVTVASSNPVNHHQAMTDPGGAPPVELDAKLFVPPDATGETVIMVPGSLGVGPNHEQHAETLVADGFVVCVLDPFGARSVASTVANQTQYSFAASAVDVLACLAVVAARPEVDSSRIAAQGHSRGGSAVIIAANRRFADAVLPDGPRLASVYAVYPWCGQQFLDPSLGSTRLRVIIGELDEWCSVQEAQGLVRSVAAAGGEATIEVVGGAHHSFDRLEPVTLLDDARVSPRMPTVHLADDGSMIDPISGIPDKAATDLDLFVAALERGFGVQGARIGGVGDQPARFDTDMLAFHRRLRS